MEEAFIKKFVSHPSYLLPPHSPTWYRKGDQILQRSGGTKVNGLTMFVFMLQMVIYRIT